MGGEEQGSTGRKEIGIREREVHTHAKISHHRFHVSHNHVQGHVVSDLQHPTPSNPSIKAYALDRLSEHVQFGQARTTIAAERCASHTDAIRQVLRLQNGRWDPLVSTCVGLRECEIEKNKSPGVQCPSVFRSTDMKTSRSRESGRRTEKTSRQG